MIAIIDYGMGNVRSVSKALEHLGFKAVLTKDPAIISNASSIIVPGVGAFADCIKNLNKYNLIPAIKDFILSGKPYLGLCLGMHILLDESEEAPGVPGLNLIHGKVKKFSPGLKIPHMGWNKINIQENNNPIFKNIPNETYAYFVHSYYVEPQHKDVIATTTDYGITFCSSIRKDNIYATQFHPEKSQTRGLEMLKNFGDLTKTS